MKNSRMARYLRDLLVVSTAVFAASPAIAQTITRMVNVSAENLFVPVGFDDNDEAVAVLDGYLPDSCYRVVAAKVTTDLTHRQIKVQAKARQINGIVCLPIPVPYTSVAKIGILPRGQFSVLTNEDSRAEPLVVVPALNAGPDDYLYAPLDGVSIQRADDGSATAVLEGRFTNSCMQWSEGRISYTGKTVQLLPVITMGEENCSAGEFPFRKVIPLQAMSAGRYLLHVRSLNGESFNNVFEIYESTISGPDARL